MAGLFEAYRIRARTQARARKRMRKILWHHKLSIDKNMRFFCFTFSLYCLNIVTLTRMMCMSKEGFESCFIAESKSIWTGIQSRVIEDCVEL